jgi:hypothetical protein
MSKEIDKYWQEQITHVLNNLLFSSIKAEDAPCSSTQHLATAIQLLHRLVPDYTIDDKECQEELEWLLELNDIKKVIDNLETYNASKEI